jgi:transposase
MKERKMFYPDIDGHGNYLMMSRTSAAIMPKPSRRVLIDETPWYRQEAMHTEISQDYKRLQKKRRLLSAASKSRNEAKGNISVKNVGPISQWKEQRKDVIVNGKEVFKAFHRREEDKLKIENVSLSSEEIRSSIEKISPYTYRAKKLFEKVQRENEMS